MSFSSEVKAELIRIKEAGNKYKEALAYGLSYGDGKNASANVLISESVYENDCELAGIFLRGVFIACGRVTDPYKGYHLELTPPNVEKAKALIDLLDERGFPAKLSEREKSGAFIYAKDSEVITDFLAYIGAGKHSMKLINAKIYKEIRNNANRAANCDSANIEKSATAAAKHLEDANYIFEVKGADFLPKELREIALIRKNNIGASLKEIGALLNPPITKSGANRRFKKIAEIAEKLRAEEKR